MKKRTILALLLSVAMCFSACDIEDWEDSESTKTEETQIDTSRTTKEDTSQESEEESKDPSKDAKSDSSSGDSGFTMSVDGSSGDLSITRAKKKDAPMGNTGSWTIFVYLCGTDLESEDENGMATDDLDQMIQAKGSGNVRFVVQTGGTSEWMNNVVSNKSCERYVIANQNIERVDAVPLRSMGESSTLSDFLTWGVENYPAEKMGVVFWNHGGGSITGVCFDELHDDDSLSLLEINQALSKAYDYVIIDLPPVGAVVDAVSVSENIDGMVVVVRENACPRGLLADCMQQLDYAGVRVLGFVMNGAMEGSGKKYQYGSGYGSYGYYNSYYK